MDAGTTSSRHVLISTYKLLRHTSGIIWVSCGSQRSRISRTECAPHALSAAAFVCLSHPPARGAGSIEAVSVAEVWSFIRTCLVGADSRASAEVWVYPPML